MNLSPAGRGSRFLVFNLVGLGGVGVQLGLLAVLSRMTDVPLAVATLLAVEAAVLHNFVWHQRWTWGDRPSSTNVSRRSPRSERSRTLERLLRFHALNGVVSLVGNVAITVALARAGVHPVVANLAAIVTCSLVNFMAGEFLVFRPSIIVFAVVATLGGTVPAAAQSPAALKGWDAYVATVDRRHADASGSFFALDVRKVDGWRERAKRGEIPMTEVDPPGIPDAKLHHWAGAIYVPKTTVQEVVNKLLEYAGRESEFYKEVTASKLLQRDGDRVRVYLRLFRDAGPVEATYNTEHAVQYRRLSPQRATNRSVSTKIAELDNPGTPQEREKGHGKDSGFLWRLNAYWRYEQVGDGVLIECESVSLSRGVPWLIRPIASPIVDRIARESLERTLRSLSAFLTQQKRGQPPFR